VKHLLSFSIDNKDARLILCVLQLFSFLSSFTPLSASCHEETSFSFNLQPFIIEWPMFLSVSFMDVASFV